MEAREGYFYMAKCQEQAERYEDAVQSLAGAIEIDPKLNEAQWKLLSICLKSRCSEPRASKRALVAQLETPGISGREKEIVQKYIDDVTAEGRGVCDRAIELATKCLAVCNDEKGTIFLTKMKADYLRILSELGDKTAIFAGVKARKFAQQAEAAYQEAIDRAKGSLSSTDPLYLGIVLNFSVLYHENLKQKAKASSLAKEAFDQAIQHLDVLAEEDYKDSTLIMQLLRDNLTLWADDDDEGEEGDGTAEETNKEKGDVPPEKRSSASSIAVTLQSKENEEKETEKTKRKETGKNAALVPKKKQPASSKSQEVEGDERKKAKEALLSKQSVSQVRRQGVQDESLAPKKEKAAPLGHEAAGGRAGGAGDLDIDPRLMAQLYAKFKAEQEAEARRAAEAAAGAAAAAEQVEPTGPRRVCFLSHYKDEAAMEARFIKDQLEGLLKEKGVQPDDIFLDSDNLHDLGELLNEVRRSDNLLLFLTRGVLTRPWVLLELHTALQQGINIIPLNIYSKQRAFDFDDAAKMKTDFSNGPGVTQDCIKELEAKGVGVARVQEVVAHVVTLIAKDLHISGSKRVLESELLDIIDRMVFPEAAAAAAAGGGAAGGCNCAVM